MEFDSFNFNEIANELNKIDNQIENNSFDFDSISKELDIIDQNNNDNKKIYKEFVNKYVQIKMVSQHKISIFELKVNEYLKLLNQILTKILDIRLHSKYIIQELCNTTALQIHNFLAREFYTLDYKFAQDVYLLFDIIKILFSHINNFID